MTYAKAGPRVIAALVALLTTMLLVGAISAPAHAAATPADIHLPFDGNLDNTQPSPPSASMGAGTASYEDGVQGKAIHLDHANYVKLEPDAGSPIDYTHSFSVAYWLKINSRVGGDPALLGNKNWGGGGNPGWVFHTGGNNISLNYRSPDSSRGDLTLAPVTPGEWTHVAATFDFQTGTIKAYVNGQNVTSDTRALSNLAGAGPTLLGQAYGSDSGALYNNAGLDNDILLDEFTLKPGALSSSDIETMYDQTRPKTGFTVTGVSVSPLNVRMDKGSEHRFTAVATGENNPLQDVTWAVDGGHGSTSIADDGTLTIDPNESASTLKVTATSKYAQVSDTATVTVTTPRTDGKVRFGVVSDVHVGVGDSKAPENNRRLAKAFQFFSDPSTDTPRLVLDGDLSGNGTWPELASFRNIVRDNLHVPLLATMGNHDENRWSNFEQATGSKANDVKIIDGYYFITVSPGSGTLDEKTGRATGDSQSDYTYQRGWVKSKIAEAEAASPDKPIFVFFHHPVKNTVYVSNEDYGTGFEDLFTGHSRVITFTGHIHSPNNNPLSIWQDGGYTAVNTTATCSADLESGMLSGETTPFTAMMSQGLSVEADKNGNVDIKTRDLTADKWIQDWKFNVNKPLPYTQANRLPMAAAPKFPDTAAVRLSNLNMTSVDLNFDQADVPDKGIGDIVHSYRFQFIDTSTGKVQKEFRDWANYWVTPRPPTISEEVTGLTKSTPYELQICGVDAYGKVGTNCLSTAFTTPAKNTKPPRLIDYALPFDGNLNNLGSAPDKVNMFLLAGTTMTGNQNYEPGRHGQAIKLDKTDFVELDHDQPIDYSQSFTTAFWVNVQADRDDGEPAILSNRNVDSSNNPGYTFRTDNYAGVNWIELEYKPVNGVYAVQKLAPVKMNGWMHLAATFDYANNKVTAYVDGQKVAEADADLSGGIGGVTGNGLIKSTFLGSSPWNYTETAGGFNGSGTAGRHDITFLADDFVMSSTVYTPEQIAAVMGDVTARPAKYTVTFNADGGDPAPQAQTLFTGGLVTEPVPPAKAGSTFGGWYTDAAHTKAWNFDTDKVTADTTLYAKWTSS